MLDGIFDWINFNEAAVITTIVVLVAAFFAKQSVDLFVRNAIRRAVKTDKHSSSAEKKQREDTLISIATGTLSLFYWPILILLLLAQLGINIAPLIAGVGVIGLALGFGAQTLVKDVISGLFIVAENQFRVGDVVQLNKEVIGQVVSLSLRTTVLRDLDGAEHHVPNGSVIVTSNYSKEFSGINLDLNVSYDSDLDKLIGIINKIGDNLAQDKNWKDTILEKPQFLRVENFADDHIVLKITGSVKPLEQWKVTGELRKRIKIAFDKAGIKFKQ